MFTNDLSNEWMNIGGITQNYEFHFPHTVSALCLFLSKFCQITPLHTVCLFSSFSSFSLMYWFWKTRSRRTNLAGENQSLKVEKEKKPSQQTRNPPTGVFNSHTLIFLACFPTNSFPRPLKCVFLTMSFFNWYNWKQSQWLWANAWIANDFW